MLNIDDKVYIINVYKYGGKVFKHFGTIINWYGIMNKSYAVKIEGCRNVNSSSGYFYFTEKDLIKVNGDINSDIQGFTMRVSRGHNSQSTQLKINSIFDIDKVYFNNPVTVVIWKDKSKTIVRAQDDEPYDDEKGLAMCIAKKAFGNKGRYYETFKKYLPKREIKKTTRNKK